MKKILIYLISLPSNLIGYLLILTIRLLWGENLKYNNGLWCTIKKDSWFYKKYYKNWSGTTLGDGGFFGPGRENYCKEHEQFHRRQYITNVIRTWMISITIVIFSNAYILAIGILIFSYFFWLIPNYFEAWLSNKPVYKGNIIEEAAYCLYKDK